MFQDHYHTQIGQLATVVMLSAICTHFIQMRSSDSFC